MLDPLEAWNTERVVAEMWWCGDAVCDCTQPIIDRITPNRDAGYPWIRRERLWDGSFHSNATPEEILAQWAELLGARERFGAVPRWRPESVPPELRDSAGAPDTKGKEESDG